MLDWHFEDVFDGGEDGKKEEIEMKEIYAVLNKVSCVLFEDKKDAEDYLGKVATNSNGVHLRIWDVIPKQNQDEISEEYRNSHLEGRFPGRDLGD
jgi:hypothetical protein